LNDKNGLYARESYLANIQSAYDPTSPEPPASSLAAWNRLTYTGHEFDPETGLYYFKARFYDPELGRFASADPYLGDSLTPPSLHRYLYAYANPLTFVDLTGYLAYRYFGRETGNGQERPYVVAEIETEDVYRHPIHSILSGYRFEDIAQQNAFLNELGRLNPGIVSVDSQGRAGWDLEVLGRAGQAVRLPVSADYRLTDAATAEIVAESGGATNMDEWRRHRLAGEMKSRVSEKAVMQLTGGTTAGGVATVLAAPLGGSVLASGLIGGVANAIATQGGQIVVGMVYGDTLSNAVDANFDLDSILISGAAGVVGGAIAYVRSGPGASSIMTLFRNGVPSAPQAASSASGKPPFPEPMAEPRYSWPGHANASSAEEQLARNIHDLPDEAVIRWGDPIGSHGSDVISVNVRSGEVTLWDSKYRGIARTVQQSQTFSDPARLQNAVNEAVETPKN